MIHLIHMPACKKLLIILGLFLFMNGSVCTRIQSHSKPKPLSQKVNLKQHSIHQQGTIILKLNKDVNLSKMKSGATFFGIKSLDILANKFKIIQIKPGFQPKKVFKASTQPDLSRMYQIFFPKDINVTVVASAFSRDPNIDYAQPIPVIQYELNPVENRKD